MIFILIFLKNCLQFNAIHDFLVWLKTGSNPTDINWYQSHNNNLLVQYTVYLLFFLLLFPLFFPTFHFIVFVDLQKYLFSILLVSKHLFFIVCVLKKNHHHFFERGIKSYFFIITLFIPASPLLNIIMHLNFLFE